MATGIYPTPGYVAVDPKEIPYGTKMYIVSADGQYVYGYAIAADTGGFIHGDRADMDLFMDTHGQCVKFGRRDIVVYFVHAGLPDLLEAPETDDPFGKKCRKNL